MLAVNQIRFHVSQRLKDLQFPYELAPGEKYPTDSGYLAFPLDLNDLSKQELGRHMAYWISWANKAKRELTLCDIEVTDTERIYRLLYNNAYSSAEGEPKDKKHKAELSQLVIDAEFERDKAKALYKYLKTLYDEYNANYKAISREITRRENIS